MSEPVRLRLRMSPGSASSGIVGRHGAGWKVRVAAAPERGRANHALLALLAETLELPRDDIAIVAGAGRRDKVVSLAGIERGELERRLELRSGSAGAA